MKKIIHKLKKNRLVSKIAALLTICMILVSSFTVSSFAADEEEATNSITDVWTGVTDSIISLIGTAQGVFFDSGSFSGSASLILETFDSNSNISSYFVNGLDFSPYLGQTISFSSSDFSIDFVLSYDEELNQFYSISNFNDFAFILVFDDGSWNLASDGSFDLDGSTFSFIASSESGDSSLTFLGTLAVVCVAIALIMLLVYVISRFLRLRG